MKDRSTSPIRIVRTPADLLDRARRRAASAISGALSNAARARRSIELLETLVRVVRQRLDAADGAAVEPAPSDPLVLPVLRILRREVLELARSPDAAVAGIELLVALESVAEPDLDAGEGGGGVTEDLRLRLRAPDAFQLLVEVAHDFRSPLTSILFLSETLRDGHSGEVSELQRSQLGLVYSAAFGLAAIASDIMDLARGGRDLVDVDPEPYSPREVFSSVERLVHPIVEEKGLELRVSLPERSSVVGHPHALSRVLLNLTTNALKYTDEGSVEIGARPRRHGRLEFYVQDTGRGIPEERRAEIFQPFKKRMGGTSGGEFFSGSGVGLSIARRLVRAMGSELELETFEGEGTRFWFVVPADASRTSTEPS